MLQEVRQQVFETAFRAARQLVCWYGPQDEELALCGDVEGLLGRPRAAFSRLDDLIGVVHLEDRPRLRDALAVGGEGARGLRLRFVHPDGSPVICEASVARTDAPPSPEGAEDALERGARGAGGVPGGGSLTVVVVRVAPRTWLGEGARHLGALIEHLPDYVSIHSTDGRCLAMNAAGRRMLGIGRDEDVGRLGFVDIVADSTSAPAHLLLPVVMSHGSHSCEVVMVDRRDDSRVPAAWSASVFDDEASKSRFVVCIARDMSEQLEIEWELRQNQRRLTHALDVSRLGEWSMDVRTQTSSQSRRVTEIFGYGSANEPWNYRMFLNHIHPDDRERVDRAFSRAIETGRDLDFEARITRRDGELRWISAKGGMNRGLAGEGRHIGGVIQDITTRKLAEQRDRFLADLSVPLNTLVDHGSTLEQVARLAVPFLADHCSIDLSTPEGGLERVVATNSLLSGEAVGSRGAGRDAPLPALLRHMLDARQPLIVDVTEPDLLDGFTRTRSERLSLRALHVRSYLGVPLILRQRRIGVMHFYRTDPAMRHSDRDKQVARELAARVAVALENARLYQALQDSDQRKDEFLAMLSHELRNPLESLSVGVSLIESETDERQRGWARSMVREQIERLSGILEDLLDVSRYTFNKVVLQREERELAPLLAGVVAEMRGRAEAQGYRMEFELGETPLYADVDPIRLGQVFANLLTNAVKYGGQRGRIGVTLEHADGMAVITVSDEGIGITAEELPNVFELFSQVDTTIDRSLGGLGMGLTLVRRIIEMHDGSVVALSDGPGRGTRFVIRLPASPQRLATGAAAREIVGDDSLRRTYGADVADVADVAGVADGANGAERRLGSANGADTDAHAGEGAGRTSPDETSVSGRSGGADDARRAPSEAARTSIRSAEGDGERAGRKPGRAATGAETGEAAPRRLMLVDDNVETVTALQRLFSMKGYEVRVANDGLEALELARRFDPHAAVLDIGLPGENGYEVARRLRERYRDRALVLIALSGYGQQKDRDRSREAGFDHHLLKPASFRSLVELLEPH